MSSDAEVYAALLEASTSLIVSRDAPSAVASDARGWLMNLGASASDAASLAALGERRLLLYRRHVRRSLARAVEIQIPRTAARLEATFDAWVQRWIDEVGPRSRYLRDMAFEFVAFAAPLWRAEPNLSPSLADLARHELAYFEFASAPEIARAGEIVDMELDRGVRFTSSARLFRYAYAVHELPEDPSSREAPPARPTALLVYRDADHDVRFLELSELAAAIVERLLSGAALGASVAQGCAAIGSPLDASVTAGTAALLEDLVARRAVLGGEPC